MVRIVQRVGRKTRLSKRPVKLICLSKLKK
jgi:hypothetical protein